MFSVANVIDVDARNRQYAHIDANARIHFLIPQVTCQTENGRRLTSVRKIILKFRFPNNFCNASSFDISTQSTKR